MLLSNVQQNGKIMHTIISLLVFYSILCFDRGREFGSVIPQNQRTEVPPFVPCQFFQLHVSYDAALGRVV